MATVTINLTNPVLLVGEKFRVSYTNTDTNITTILPDRTDNADLILTLPEGNYYFTVSLQKADNTICEPKSFKFTVDPPPDVDPPPIVDPPVTLPVTCNCVAVTSSKIIKGCDGFIIIQLLLDYPATKLPCSIKVFYKLDPNGIEVMQVYNSVQTTISIPVLYTNYLSYKIVMVCCTDNTETVCDDWTQVEVIENCSCAAPSISIISQQSSGQATIVSINIGASVPSYPPYDVMFTDGLISTSQVYNSAGLQSFVIPQTFVSGVISVSNVCGAANIPITRNICTDPVVITQVIRDFALNTIKVTYTSSGVSNHVIELFERKTYYIAPTYSATEPLNVFTHTFNVDNYFINLYEIIVRVRDVCWQDEKIDIF